MWTPHCTCCMSEKSCQFLYSDYTKKNGQHFWTYSWRIKTSEKTNHCMIGGNRFTVQSYSWSAASTGTRFLGLWVPLTRTDIGPGPAGLRGFMLDPTLCRVQIQTTVLYVLINFLCSFQKCILYIVSGLCTGFDKHEPVLVGKLLRLLVRHVPLALQVRLIPNQENHSVWVGEVPGVRQPGGEVVIRGPSCDVIDKQGSCRPSVVTPRYSTKPLLSSCVPDLELDFLARNLNYSGSKLDSNGVRAIGHKFFLCELMQETGFADAHVPDDDVLEDVRVVVRPGSHLGSCLLQLGCEGKDMWWKIVVEKQTYLQ